VKVNKGISTTLANPEQEDLWWPNNGTTILASAVIYNDRKLHITNPLVVNGLSDKIITATNSQTKIEAINLHATEQIQRHIEMALKAHDLYYDRRKN
jgi:hypothetical protein